MDMPHHFIGWGRDKLERYSPAGFRRKHSPDRFRENSRREKINCGVRNAEFRTKDKKVFIPHCFRRNALAKAGALCIAQLRTILG